MTASYQLSWILSPFGMILAFISITLYVKSHRLKIEDFKLNSSAKINEIMRPINTTNSKLISEIEEQQSPLNMELA